MVVLNEVLVDARERIAELELDILFYQDIGMEPFTYFLAFSRLAQVQCTSFGHPDTTGIPNIDYFVSSDLYEIENAQLHYSETLFLLRNVGVLAYYYPVKFSAVLKSKSHFGLSSEKNIYICPQTLFKFHPDFDHIFSEILRLDSNGLIVLIEGTVEGLAHPFQQRLQQVMPDVIDRIVFLPPQAHHDFLNLLQLSDVMLDIPSFNGMNSSLEAFYFGIPVVTLPGDLQRTRHTTGMYLKMGIADCIARDTNHYVDICLKLTRDKVFRADIHKKILDRNFLLFEDDNVIAEFSRFFEEALSRKKIKVK